MSQISAVIDGVWQFTSRQQGAHQKCNGYIVHLDEERVYLIDPPKDLTRDEVMFATSRREINDIFLTHVQEEHGAGIEKFPEAVVHVPSGDEYLCQGKSAYNKMITAWAEPWEWETRGNYPGHVAGARNERPLAFPVVLGASLRADEKLLGFDVVATPGHGKNSVTLLVNVGGSRVAFCGDLIYGKGQLWNWFDADWDYGLQEGQQKLRHSSQKLTAYFPDLLCPAHGPIIDEPSLSLELLGRNLDAILQTPSVEEPLALNFPNKDSQAPGFREITPHIHQWKTGNAIIITSDNGRAIVIDDGLCIWEPLPIRIQKHDDVFRQMKAALGIHTIDWIIPTHYHGDHTEFIPHLAKTEGARIIALESVSGPMEFPESYNLACSLPWYGTVAQRLKIHEHVPENYTLDWADYRLTFFHLGGQTKHHLGIEAVVDGLRTLFVGDSWWGTGTVAGPVLCWNEADPEQGGWAYALDRMLQRNPELLVTGHGSALRDPIPYLHAARITWRERIAAFAKLNPRESTGLFFDPSLSS